MGSPPHLGGRSVRVTVWTPSVSTAGHLVFVIFMFSLRFPPLWLSLFFLLTYFTSFFQDLHVPD